MNKLVLLFCLGFVPLFSLDPSDRAQIEKMIHHYEDAHNNHVGAGFSEGFTDDATYTNIFGTTFHGKKEIEDRHVEIRKTIMKNSKMTVTDIELHEAEPGLVIAIVHWKTTGMVLGGPGSPPETREGVLTQTFFKRNNQWQIPASQNTMIPKVSKEAPQLQKEPALK